MQMILKLYILIKLEETNQLSKIQACLKDIKIWMTCNFRQNRSNFTQP